MLKNKGHLPNPDKPEPIKIGCWFLDPGFLMIDPGCVFLDSGLSSIQRPVSSICNKYKMNRLHYIDNLLSILWRKTPNTMAKSYEQISDNYFPAVYLSLSQAGIYWYLNMLIKHRLCHVKRLIGLNHQHCRCDPWNPNNPVAHAWKTSFPWDLKGYIGLITIWILAHLR